MSNHTFSHDSNNKPSASGLPPHFKTINGLAPHPSLSPHLDCWASQKTRFPLMTVLKFAVLRHTRAKDGTYKIRLAIGHQSQTHYIVTPYKVSNPTDLVNGVVVRGTNSTEINLHLSQMLADYNGRLSRIPDPDQYTCTQLRTILLSMRPSQSDATFLSVANEYAQELTLSNRQTYARMIGYISRGFSEFMHGDVFLSTISPSIIQQYQAHLRSLSLSDTSVGIYLRTIKVIINRAIRLRLVSYSVHPFSLTIMPMSQERELDISVSDLRRIRDAEIRNYDRRKYRDLFLLSYYLGGINFIDLIRYDFRNTDTLEYSRYKSRNTKRGDKRVSFTIQPEAREIIDRYMDKRTGHIFLPDIKYVSLQNVINKNLKAIGKELSIRNHERLCWYTARKSFVQHGFELGITLEVLEYTIGQSVKTNRPIFNYLKIMRRHADDAIRRIIDNLQQSPPSAP